MADGVDKLKELLFQQEAATLVDLEQRVAEVARAEERARAQIGDNLRQLEAIRRLGDETRRLQAEVELRLARLDDRAGSAEALKKSVTEVIDKVFDEARSNEPKQAEVSRALAPMLVKMIKSELKNNQAEMVEALYPITGQLVKSYVASAMKDLASKMNRGLETNRLMLRLRSLLSGYSPAELKLAETQQLEVEEIYLIRRGSGELLLRFPESLQPAADDDAQHMSGVLAAINEFAARAFQADGGHLRAFDADDFRLFLRASPVYLLAAKCRGVPAPGVETVLDTEFLTTVPQLHAAEEAGDLSAAPIRLMADLKTRVENGIAGRHAELARAGLPFSPLRALAGLALVALLAGGGWLVWTGMEVERTRAAAQRVVADTPSMRGYPVTLEVGPRGQTLAVSGLAPNAGARAQLMERLAAELREVAVVDKGLAALPGVSPDPTPAIEALRRDLGTVATVVRRDIGSVEASVRKELGGVETALRSDLGALERQTARAAALRALERARRRLEEALPDLVALAGLQEPGRRGLVATVHKAADAAVVGLAAQSTALGTRTHDAAHDARVTEALGGTAAQLRRAALELSGVIGQRAVPAAAPGPAVRRAPGDLAEAAETAALAAERLAGVAAAALQAASIRIPEPPRIPAPTALDRLQAYTARHAVFFANNEDFRDAAAATAVIAEVARLALEAGVVIRVIGYTDERGGQARNSLLAQSRAERIARALVERGVPRGRIIAVGRATGPDLSPSVGPDSANRRVAFEVAFDGEPQQGP